MKPSENFYEEIKNVSNNVLELSKDIENNPNLIMLRLKMNALITNKLILLLEKDVMSNGKIKIESLLQEVDKTLTAGMTILKCKQ